MGVIVFLPGILGSSLDLEGEEVWPPTPLEATRGYGRTEKLLDERVRVKGVIRNIWCLAVYEPLLDQLDAIAQRSAGGLRVESWAYDWRRDVRETGGGLGDRLRVLAEAGEEIHLVAHSLGGLVARWALEQAGLEPATLGAVKTLLTLATPNTGAPVAVARVLGVEGTSGLSGAAVRRLSADQRYPSTYQLLPRPDHRVLWDVRRGLKALDLYGQDGLELGLSAPNLEAARALHAGLDGSGRPGGVRYAAVGATGHSTCIRVERLRRGFNIEKADDAGDGTVPLWSAVSAADPHELCPGEHAKFFKHGRLISALYRNFGLQPPGEPYAEQETRVAVSTDALVYAPGAAQDVLLLPLTPRGRISGDLKLERSADPSRVPLASYGLPIPVAYEGPPTTLVRLKLAAPAEPGHYRITFSSIDSAVHDADQSHFAVQAEEGSPHA